MTPDRIKDISCFRDKLLNDTLLWSAVTAVPGVVFSTWRAVVVGWKPVMTLHLVVLGVLWAIWLLRSRLSYHTRIGVLLAVMLIVIYAGLAQFGPAAGAQSFAIVLAFTSMLFLSPRAAWLLVAANTTGLILIGYATTQNWFPYNFDYEAYAHHPTTWFNLIWTLVSYGTALAYIVWRMMTELQTRQHSTERLLERHQETLTESKRLAQMQHDILESIPDAVVVSDRAGNITLVNEQTVAMFGHPREELIGAPVELLLPQALKAIHAQHRQDYLVKPVIRAMGTGVELVAITRDGSKVPVDVGLGPVHVLNGMMVVASLRDISDRRRAEENLRRERDRAQRYLDTVQTIMVSMDMDGRITMINRKGCEILGYCADELLGCNWFEKCLPSPRVVETVTTVFRQLIAGNLAAAEYFENLVLCRDGRQLLIAWHSAMSTDDDGRVVGTLSSGEDITERRQVEIKLRDSEERFSIAVEGAGHGILDWNIRTGKLLCSRLCMAMLGYAENDIPQHINAWRGRVHPDDKRRVQKSLIAYLTDQRPNYVIELRLRCKDHGYKWILCRASIAARDREDKAIRMIGVFTDISVRKAEEAELVAAREAAEQASKAKTTFLANMSHELRTPLNAIIGFAQMLEMGVPDPITPAQKEAISHILSGGRHLLQLVDEVLGLARIEAGQLDLIIEAVHLAPLIDETERLLLPAAAMRRIIIRRSCGDNKLVLADRSRVRQILLNLLSNAVKYNRDDGHVDVSCSVSGGNVRVTVTDTGQGISEVHREEVFEPFQRLGAESTAIEGCGIGLVICKHLVEAMGGAIGFDSIEGTGSRFWFELPLASGDLEKPVNATAIAYAALDTAAKPIEGRVLYVEDNLANLTLMRHVFRMLPDIEFVAAPDGETALAMLADVAPDLVLLDINLPGMSGREVLKRMKADRRWVSLPVIAVSAAAMPSDIKVGIEAGFLAYFTKPIDVPVFLERVRKILRKSR